jgi:AcrR family transcriptional regulator
MERAVVKERRISPEVAANYTRVLDVAARVFDEKGYHAATMQDIADEADLTKGGLYHYLTGKAETLFAINERYLRAGLAEIQEIADDETLGPLEKVGRLATTIAAQHDTFNPDLRVALREFFAEGADTQTRLIALRDEYESIVKSVIAEGVAAGEIIDADPNLLVKFFFGPMNWMSIWYRAGRYSAKEIGEVFSGLLTQAFAAKP